MYVDIYMKLLFHENIYTSHYIYLQIQCASTWLPHINICYYSYLYNIIMSIGAKGALLGSP